MNQIACYIPKWMETLPQDHDMKKQMIQILQEEMKNRSKEDGWQKKLTDKLKSLEFVQNVFQEEGDNEEQLCLQIAVKEAYYYAMLSEWSGVAIEGEYRLISLIRELGSQKAEYEAVHGAIQSVRETGYGVILPGREEIQWEEPVMTHTNHGYGVKMKAVTPTIHLLKASVDAEISPIVGTQNQAEDLIRYIQSGAKESDGIWEINFFGKTVEQLIQEGMTSKLNQFTQEKQEKIQKVISRILDESKTGVICLII